MESHKFLSPAEVEAQYCIPRGSLANMRFARRGPQFFKIGKKVLYKVVDIERWISEGLVLTSEE